MITANAAVREAIRKAGVRQWEIADRLQITEFTFCRWMRHELSEGKQKQILEIINQLAEERRINE